MKRMIVLSGIAPDLVWVLEGLRPTELVKRTEAVPFTAARE
jgi:hypothetical protein